MELEDEIQNYLELNPQKTAEQVIKFLSKLWNSSSLKSQSKYDVILNYFAKNLLSKVLGEDDCAAEVKRFFRLKHAASCVDMKTKKNLVRSLCAAVTKTPSLNAIDACMEVVSHESFKDYFKNHLEIYCELMKALIVAYQAISVEDPNISRGVFFSIISEFYYFAKSDKFRDLFLTFIVPLSEAAKKNDPSAMWDLLKSIYFSNFTQSDVSLEIFQSEIPEDKLFILIEAFIAINKFKQQDIIRFIKFFLEALESEENAQFLSQTKQLFLLLQKHEVDIAVIKRQESDLLEKISARVNVAIEASKDTMDFAELMETLSSFISCDAFLFEKNIYQILADSMLREKCPADLVSYEVLLKVVIKIYGKDVNQFLKKLLKAFDEKLNSFKIPKKRKRKLTSVSEVSSKKRKLVDTSEETGELSFIGHIWPQATSEIFAEIVAGLNVAQTIKVWKQLNEFLVNVLNQVKDSSSINENVLFKIDFVSNLLCAVFDHTRIHEQLMYKSKEISAVTQDFSNAQHLFYEIILNIEYNDRVMNAFLKLSCSFQEFLMLYFYHHNSEDKDDLSSLFIANQSRMKTEWNVIQQRVKNFGKTEEKNNLNVMMIQQHENDQLFNSTEVMKPEVCSSILNDEKQIEFLLQRTNTRSFFIASLGSKELRILAQYLVKSEDKQLQSKVIVVIAASQKLLDGFITELMEIDTADFKTTLDIINQLPLDCASDENKKVIFGEILKQKASKDTKPLVISAVDKLFKNDSYRTFFKDFSMKQIIEVFTDVVGFSRVYQVIISNAARKLNVNALENFEWILNHNNNDILKNLAKAVSEVSLAPVSGVTVDMINKFKRDLIHKMLEKKSLDGFSLTAKLCSDNAGMLKEDSKSQYMELLQKFLKKVAKSPSADGVTSLLTTLKDAKKFNLNDEIKGSVVDTLLAYLKSVIREKMTSDVADYLNMDLEKQIFASLKPFKSNYQEGCVDNLRQILAEKTLVSSGQFQYSFKVYQVAFENKADAKSSSGLVKSYIKFVNDFVNKALELDTEKTAALIHILDTNNAILKDNKNQLDNTAIDDLLGLLMDPRMKPPAENIEDFCKFYTAVGEMLFVIANVRQNYFKSRVAQYFNVYRYFMEAIYFFKNDQPEELTPMEISLLLKLTLQLEHIMSMIMKIHSSAIKIIALYVASAAVNIFVKNPKTLTVGHKFKINIKNICYQLLSTFDDKTRKHVYSVADETTREVYDGLFNEFRRRS